MINRSPAGSPTLATLAGLPMHHISARSLGQTSAGARARFFRPPPPLQLHRLSIIFARGGRVELK